MVDVSLIIVSWNAREHLLKCLKSIEDTRAGLHVEVIVVDNASSDGSPEAVARLFPGVRLIETGANLGFAKGNNVGIAEAKGRHLALVNSDVILLDGCLQKLVAFMDAHPQIGMAGPRVLNPDQTLQISARRLPSLWSNFGQALFLNRVPILGAIFPPPEILPCENDRTKTVPVIYGMFWMVSRNALDAVGGLDPDFFMYGEDVDWCKRFHEARWDIVYFPESRAIHFGGASSANEPIRFSLERIRSRLLYFRKHHGRTGEIAEWAVLFVDSVLRYAGWSVAGLLLPAKREQCRTVQNRQLAHVRFLLGKREHSSRKEKGNSCG